MDRPGSIVIERTHTTSLSWVRCAVRKRPCDNGHETVTQVREITSDLDPTPVARSLLSQGGHGR